MTPMQIVDASGKPARSAVSEHCPQCGADKDKRVASSGFGTPRPVCSVCGYEWIGDVWRGV